MAVPQYPILLFWTVSVFYRVSDVDVSRGSASLFVREGKKGGTLAIDHYEEMDFLRLVDRSSSFFYPILGTFGLTA